MVKTGIVALCALFLIIGCCQANAVSRGEHEAKDHDDLIPYLFLMNGATSVATPAVCVLSTLSSGVIFLFSQYV